MATAAHSHQTAEAEESCPYCGHEVTHDEFLEIQARIAKEEKQKFDKQLKAHEKQLNAKHLSETSELHKKLAEQEDAAKKVLADEREKQAKALKAAEDKAAKNAKQIRQAEREKVEQEHAAANKKLADEREAFQQQRKEFNDAKAEREAAHKAEIDNVRKLEQADKEKQLLAQKAMWDKDSYKLKQKLEDATRKLEKQSNEELGDGAEVELYTELKQAFPDDVITRVKKGTAGADIIHEVHVDGRACGKLVYDSKNRNNWKVAYADKLRKDQLAEEAGYAILATRKFPQNTREMTSVKGVQLINPARAVILASLIRETLIRLSSVKLSEQGKADKQEKLFEFITLVNCSNLFQQVVNEIENLRALDVKEKTQQEKMRSDRAKHVTEVEKTVLGTLQDEINKILGV